MKLFFAVMLLINASITNSQNIISTPFFSFNCDCKEVENQYNKTNKSFNYSYQTNDGNSVYMISVKKDVSNDSGFLKSIKNSGTFNYEDSTFLGNKAIIANMKMNGQFGIHVGFFRNNIGYSIIVGSKSLPEVNSLFTRLSKRLILK
jgi:hypothetical protein